MTRRGLAPTASVLAAILAAEAALACVPRALTDSTTLAAVAFAASKAATPGLVSPEVISLTESVLGTMAFARLKMATHLALSFGIVATAVWLFAFRDARAPAVPGAGTRQPAEEPAVAANAVLPKEDNPQPINFAVASASAADSALAPGAIESRTKDDRQKAAPKPPDDKATASPQRQDDPVKSPDANPSRPETDVAAYARRLLREEQARGGVLLCQRMGAQ